MPDEIKNYLERSGKKIVYSSDEYKKEIVFCAVIGDYLLERQKGRSLLDAVHNTKFSISDQMITHKVLINYFKLM